MNLFDVNEFHMSTSDGVTTLWVNASFEGIHEGYPVDMTTTITLTPEDTERLADGANTMATMIDFIDDVHGQIDWERVTD